jgi:hypothetical protein
VNDNSNEPDLVVALRASVAWCVWRGQPVRDVMPPGERERRVVDVGRDERAEGRGTCRTGDR